MSNFWPENTGWNGLDFTLTFAQDIKNPKEAQRRFNSLATHVLRTRYLEYIRVWERTKKGRIHYHLLVVLANDIRTGFNFLEAEFGIYKDVPKAIRSEWAFWRTTAKEYGFGRTELLLFVALPRALPDTSENTFPSTSANAKNATKGFVWWSTAGALGKCLHASLSTLPAPMIGGASWNCSVPMSRASRATA